MTKVKNPLVFLDVSIDGDPYEKMVFELFFDVAPKTAENFRALCTGEMGTGSRSGKPLHYKGSFFHRIVKGSMAEGGDFVKRDGSSGESIYGSNFPDELPKLKHDQPGILSMSVSNREHSGSQFILTFKPNHSFDRKFVVFGKLVHGDEVLKKIEAAGDENGSPNVTVKIVNCGEFKDGKRKLHKLKMSKDNSNDIDNLEGRKKDKHKKSSRERRKKRKGHYSSDSDTSSDDSESELSDSETSDSETDLSSSEDNSSDDRRRKRKRSYKRDRHRRGRKRDGRKDKKRRRRDKKSRRRSRRSYDSSNDDSDSGSSSRESGDDETTNDKKRKSSDQPKANTLKVNEFPTVNGRARTNGVDAENVENLRRRSSPQKSTSKSLSISPKNNSVSPRSLNKSPTNPPFDKSPKKMAAGERSYSPAARPQPRRISPRAIRSPIRREPSPIRTRVGRSTRRSVSRSPQRRARSPSGGSLSVSPDGSPKRIRRGRGFSDRFAYARRYRTPSPTRSPVRHRFGGRNERERYTSYRRYSPKRFRSPPRRTPPRYRNRRSYSRSQSASRSPRYRGGRRYSRSLSRSRSPAGAPRVLKNERRRSRSVSRSPSRSRSSVSPSPVGRSKSSSDSGVKKGLVSYDDGSP